jgi:hypothetical protein
MRRRVLQGMVVGAVQCVVYAGTSGLPVSQASPMQLSEAEAWIFCPAGKYKLHGIEGQICVLCYYGKYGNISRTKSAIAAICIDCPAGKFQKHDGQVACHSCPVGTLSLAGGHKCTAVKAESDCPAGKFLHGVVVTVICTSCPGGKFQPSHSASSCLSCPTGKFASWVTETARTRCQRCATGNFQVRHISCTQRTLTCALYSCVVGLGWSNFVRVVQLG